MEKHDALSMRTESDSITLTPSNDSSSTIEASPVLTPSESGTSDIYGSATVCSNSFYESSISSSLPHPPSHHGTDPSSEFSAHFLLQPEHNNMSLFPKEEYGAESFAEKGSPPPFAETPRKQAKCQHFRKIMRKIAHLGLALCVLSALIGFWKPNLRAEPPSSHKPTTSRRTYLNTGSNSLQGKYPLYDVLHITSSSGSINIDVEPQEADADDPKPAKLIIESNSGSINVNMRGSSFFGSIPDREYITSISIPSGSVQGSLVHGKSTSVITKSGSIRLDILAYKPKSASTFNTSSDSSSLSKKKWTSSLTTRSESGSQHISLSSASSSSASADSFGLMESTHTSQSGQVQLTYPSDWFGKIRGQSGSGSLSVHGPGVRIIEQDGGASGRKYIVAERGDKGDGKLEFETQSGSAGLTFQ